LWVTKARPSEIRFKDLDSYENGETLVGAAATVWHHAPVLHMARDEDFGVNGTNPGQGSAITSWAGVEFKPRNFFPSTPLYP